MRKSKDYSNISIICIIGMIFSLINAGAIILTKNSEFRTNDNQKIQIYASPLSSNYQFPPVSILVYIEYADIDEEFVNTMQAIDNTYGTDYYYETLTDYTTLNSSLSGHDILLIPEQELAPNANTMKSIGTYWTNTLNNFVNDGGIIILLDFCTVSLLYGPGQHIYNESGLMNLNGYINHGGSMTSLHLANENDALARNVSTSPWPDRSGTISVDTSDGVVVVEDDNNDPVVIHKIMGKGHIIYCGFDLYRSDSNYENLLGNAIRLHRHVIFDESKNPLGTISKEYSSLVDDLLNENFAVSNMTNFDPLYLNSSEVLIITRPTAVYSPSQIDDIEAFAKNGGGIFVASEFSVYGNLLDPIIERFGFGRNKTNYLNDDENGGDPAWIIYDNIPNHLVTSDVSSVQFFVGSGFTTLPPSAIPLISTDTDGTSTWDSGYPANGVPVVSSVITEGNGRVIACCDNSFMYDDVDFDNDMTNDYFDEDNSKFLLNAIYWLSGASETSTLGGSSSGGSSGDNSKDGEISLLMIMIILGTIAGIIALTAIVLFIKKKK